MHVTSTAYADRGIIPARFANMKVPGGRNVSIPLSWSGMPEGTRSLAVAMIDHHPVAHGWVHWVVADIPAGTGSLPEGASRTDGMPAGAVELSGTSGTPGYSGPQPPAGSGLHDYEATVFALDVSSLGLDPSDGWEDLSAAMRHHVLDRGSVVGRLGT